MAKCFISIILIMAFASKLVVLAFATQESSALFETMDTYTQYTLGCAAGGLPTVALYTNNDCVTSSS